MCDGDEECIEKCKNDPKCVLSVKKECNGDYNCEKECLEDPACVLVPKDTLSNEPGPNGTSEPTRVEMTEAATASAKAVENRKKVGKKILSSVRELKTRILRK